MNSKDFKIVCKLVKQIKKAVVIFTTEGVVGDLKNNVHPGDTALIPNWGAKGTVAAVTSIPDWSTTPIIMDEIIAGVIGRITRFWLLENGVQLHLLAPQQIIEMMQLTDDLQRQAIIHFCGQEKYDEYVSKRETLSEEQLLDTMQLVALMLAAQGPGDTVH